VTPLPGNDLPSLITDGFVVREAAPSPPPGPERDAIVALNDARARAAEDAVIGVLQRHLDQSLGVVLARMRGPKARRHTKWWTTSESASMLEVKALDATYVVPDKLTGGLARDVRPVMFTVASDAARDTAQRLGDPEDIAAFDSEEIERAVDEAVRVILGIADRHLRELRQAVLDADTSATDLENLLDLIEQAHRRGGNWVLMSGRTLANALANAASYEQALRLGCTHAQWVSRRDDRVRPTHVNADGQVRRMGVDFKVGKFELKHPADPALLPASWPEVAGCRCRLTYRRPSDSAQALFEVIDRAIHDGSAPLRAADAVAVALSAAAATQDAPYTPAPHGYGFPPAAPLVTLPDAVVGYRLMPDGFDAVPGQQIVTFEQLVLGLAWVGAATALTLAVLIPAGTVVAATNGAIILPGGVVLEVLGASETGIRAQVVP